MTVVRMYLTNLRALASSVPRVGKRWLRWAENLVADMFLKIDAASAAELPRICAAAQNLDYGLQTCSATVLYWPRCGELTENAGWCAVAPDRAHLAEESYPCY